MRLWKNPRVARLGADIMEGMYLVPPAMLAVQEPGRTVVIDGNRQLAALMACHNPEIWEQIRTETGTDGNEEKRRQPC